MPFILILLLFLSGSVSAQPPLAGNWTLSFEDDFDDLDQDRWNLNLGKNRLTLGSSVCFFLENNAKVANGNLMLISKREKLKLRNQRDELVRTKYSSGLINSFGKFAQRYGYFEARMKLPKAKGLWPSFWLMPNRTRIGEELKPRARSTYIEDSPHLQYKGKGMEIDVIEHLTRWGPNQFHYAAHWDGAKSEHKMIGDPYQIAETGEYIKFGLYWDKDILVWFTDDKEVFRWQNERIAEVPMHLILSTQMGGWAEDIDNDELPAITYVDYVRVWSGQAKPQGFIEYDASSAQITGKWKKKASCLRSKKSWFRRFREQKITWNLNDIKPGKYRLALRWPNTKKKLASKIKLRVGSAGSEQVVGFSQKGNSNYWLELGDFELDANSYISIDASETNQYVLLDKLRLEVLD